MHLSSQITSLFDDALSNKKEAALLHACTSVDATARSLYPSEVSSRKRFLRCIREYMWLIEPMMGVGFNLVDTKFSNVNILKQRIAPDFADLVYYIHRCNHAHGNEVPIDFAMTESNDMFQSGWALGPNCVRVPDRLIWALAAVTVFSRANYRLLGQGGDRCLYWGTEPYRISEWWGREELLKPIFAKRNTMRVELKELSRLNAADPATGEEIESNLMAPPPNA